MLIGRAGLRGCLIGAAALTVCVQAQQPEYVMPDPMRDVAEI
jgi:hypothetical protein